MDDPRTPLLTITADDYGLAHDYDAGILEAARAGAVDGVGVMVMRDPDPSLLAACAVEIGLHLELPGGLDRATAALAEQLERFRALFDRPPAYLDGHHHCHAAAGGPALAVARLARRLGLPVRSVSARHRRLLRYQGVATCDRLLGRLSEREPALPAPIARSLAGASLPPGATEWMVHPGHPGGGSSYDRGRGEDLALVLELSERLDVAGVGRATWSQIGARERFRVG